MIEGACQKGHEAENIPSSAEEGWLREVRKSCEASILRRRGGVGQDFLTSTTLSAPQKVLRDIFLMSRPPYSAEEGKLRLHDVSSRQAGLTTHLAGHGRHSN